MADQITLDDVARLAGVSRATASRAVNNQPGVRPELRQKVLRSADKLGFRPNRAAQNLASGRSSVIGLVIPSSELRVDPYGASMTHAVGRVAAANDLGLMLHLAEDEPGATVNHILRDGLIDGLLVSSVATGRLWVEALLNDASLPTMLIGTHPTRSDIGSVDVENTESSAAIVTHLFDQGCRRLATITGPMSRADAKARLAGFRLAHQRAGIEVDEALVMHGDFTPASANVAAARLLERAATAPFDGLVAGNDQMALAAMWTFARQGLRVPDDIAVVGFDGTSIGPDEPMQLTTMCQPFDQIASRALEELLARIDGRYSAEAVVLQPQLVIGDSSIRTHADAGAASARGSSSKPT